MPNVALDVLRLLPDASGVLRIDIWVVCTVR